MAIGSCTLTLEHDVALVDGTFLQAEDVIDNLQAHLAILHLQHFQDVQSGTHAPTRASALAGLTNHRVRGFAVALGTV